MDIGHNDSNDGDDGDQYLLAIRAALASGADPHAVAGVLAEGVTYAIARHVPLDERDNAAVAILMLLSERLMANRSQ